MDSLPAAVAKVASELSGLPGAAAVVLGGSRAKGTQRPSSDWDLGVPTAARSMRTASGGSGAEDVDALAATLGVEPLSPR